MSIYFVTSNKNKLQEASLILGRNIKGLDLDVKEIQSIDVKDIIEDKAAVAYKKVNEPVIVEDTGLYVKSMSGFPGALVKWVLKSVGNDGMCKMIDGYADRSAYAETSVCYYDGRDFRIFNGRIDGVIAEKPRGSTGFGWDPIFQPIGYSLTFAEMSSDEKNKISMRKLAFTSLREYLDSVGK